MNNNRSVLKEMKTGMADLKCDPDGWVDRHGDCLYRYALLRLRNRDLAEEIVQETLLAGLQAKEKFGGQSSERTWLIGILKHKVIDYFRKASRECPLEDEIVTSDDDSFHPSGELAGHWIVSNGPIDWDTHPSSTIEQKEFWRAFERALSQLPPRLAHVFVLREMEELSTAEICAVLNITESNLWVMLHRARLQLRKLLEAGFFARKNKPVDQRAFAPAKDPMPA